MRTASSCSWVGLILGISMVGASVSACDGETVGSEGRPVPDPNAPTETTALAFTPEEVDAALATCSSPHGPVEPYNTVDGLVALLSGR